MTDKERKPPMTGKVVRGFLYVAELARIKLESDIHSSLTRVQRWEAEHAMEWMRTTAAWKAKNKAMRKKTLGQSVQEVQEDEEVEETFD